MNEILCGNLRSKRKKKKGKSIFMETLGKMCTSCVSFVKALAIKR